MGKAPGPGIRLPRAVVAAIAVVCVAVVVAVIVGAVVAPDAGAPDGVGVLEEHRATVGEPAPDFALADARTGEVRRLSDFHGQVIVLNWFASWCGPCWAEMPDFQEAFEQLEGDLVVIGVNLQEGREEAMEVVEGTGVTYPILLDPEGEVAAHYRIPGLPATYFIDEEGVIRALGPGRVPPEALAAELTGLGLTYRP